MVHPHKVNLDLRSLDQDLVLASESLSAWYQDLELFDICGKRIPFEQCGDLVRERGFKIVHFSNKNAYRSEQFDSLTKKKRIQTCLFCGPKSNVTLTEKAGYSL